ncbi:hypothetical protein TNCV_3495761 [Trichonephila clavipes]|nr:hypothetical protein TNCV_3495761 [Trichonephila clavipes]
MEINSDMYNDEVQEVPDSHNQELTFDELIEKHEGGFRAGQTGHQPGEREGWFFPFLSGAANLLEPALVPPASKKKLQQNARLCVALKGIAKRKGREKKSRYMCNNCNVGQYAAPCFRMRGSSRTESVTRKAFAVE